MLHGLCSGCFYTSNVQTELLELVRDIFVGVTACTFVRTLLSHSVQANYCFFRAEMFNCIALNKENQQGWVQP